MYDLDAKEAANLSTKITKFGEAFLFQLKKQTKTNITHTKHITNQQTNTCIQPNLSRKITKLCAASLFQLKKQNKQKIHVKPFYENYKAWCSHPFQTQNNKIHKQTNNKQTNTGIKPFHTDHKARYSLPPQSQQTNKQTTTTKYTQTKQIKNKQKRVLNLSTKITKFGAAPLLKLRHSATRPAHVLTTKIYGGSVSSKDCRIWRMRWSLFV